MALACGAKDPQLIGILLLPQGSDKLLFKVLTC